MPFGRSLLQRESLYRVSGEERSPEILILFHSSGSTSNQWRKLKNPLFPGRTEPDSFTSWELSVTNSDSVAISSE
uniref:Ribosomal protein L10 n=3 Tax=Brassiceae TaxID=981071 RepID=A0A650GAU0_RAPSA|nr:ribosomal protein L10 [Brassica oleracea var. capitata]QGW48468.1 hypothetical protein [Raphanus sativus]QWC55381.1 ribosomal protein L10 [Brassica oleracea var. gongylodes]USF18082.1 ribosomal protein L10 [Brassica oleracea var. italica]WAW83338.1 ribosomal protein L10 [Brassica rapa var. purpuraria]